LKICASIAPPSQSPEPLYKTFYQQSVQKHTNEMTKINFPTSSLEQREYKYLFQKGDEKLSFDFNVKNEYHSEKRLIKINRKNLLINDENLDETLIGNLVFQASEALFPLVLQINSFGYPIAIFNASEILERWKSFIPRFQEYYDNERSINLLNHIGKLYKNPEKLLKGLQNDWFCSTFFFPIYGDYQKNEIIELDYSFAEKTNFKTELSLTEEKTENGKTKISLCIDSSNEENSENKGHFLLNSDRSIHEIKLDFGFSDIQKNINIFIQETKEISERKTKTNVVFDEKEEQEKLRKSKSLFIEEIDHKDILPKHR
jgi:hypothetical protein